MILAKIMNSPKAKALRMLCIDSLWSLGMAAEWQWTERRSVYASASYLGVGDAPVTTGEIEGLGTLSGEYKSRDLWLFQVGIRWGGL